jgi:hypothetical protein
MKNITTNINGNTISMEFDHHYNNIYCVDLYINDTFQRNENLDLKTRLAITKWVVKTIRSTVALDVVLCTAGYGADGHKDYRIKLFIKLGFKADGSGLMYLG